MTSYNSLFFPLVFAWKFTQVIDDLLSNIKKEAKISLDSLTAFKI